MAEEFQGGVCGGTWWNHNFFSGGGGGGGGGGGFSSPCSVAQLGGGGYDMGGFGWPHDIMKGRCNDQVCDDNNLDFSSDFDSTFDILGFSLSPTSSTTNWSQQHHFCKGGSSEENYDSMLQDNLSSRLNYELEANIPTMINNSTKFTNQDGSSPTTITTSSNSSGNSSTSFPMNSSTSYLIQTLFEDVDNQPQVSLPQPMSQLINPNNNYGFMESQVLTSANNISLIQPPSSPPFLQLPQSHKFDERMNMLNNGNVRSSLLNSLQPQSTTPSFNLKSHNCDELITKLKHEEVCQESKKNMNNDQPAVKRLRIETPSSLPTFKVRKEKLGDRITALQQLVSPFGKTDTASVLHEAIEYIKFLHDQVQVLSAPYLKNEAAVQHQQVSNNKREQDKQDLRSRGLCLVPISSTYPVTQETPVDFWTPTFGGTTFR